MKKDINIREVAKKAGVSMATVSRVFNNSGPVKESTRKLVERVIEETNYRPNVLARELIDKKTAVIGLIVHDMTGEGIPRMINGVNELLEENGYHLLIASSKGKMELEKKHFELFHLKRVEGIIFATRRFTPEHAAYLKKLSVPVVVLLQDTGNKNISCVTFDNRGLAARSAEVLLEKGHRQFAFIGGPEDSVNAQERKNGFIGKLAEYHCSFDEELFRPTDFYIRSGYLAAEEIITAKKPFTALVSINDGLALGAMNCLLDHGYRIPEDVSIMSLDNTVLSQASRIPLAGVSFSYYDLGKEGASIILHQLQSEEWTCQKRVMPYTVEILDTIASRKNN
ncbi:LacI family DNA-binding transcriptional regulator [Bacillaceae bacterium Marseille-Q3522]|nr:LacI family DNA-binding transcriptional regulator [Bacillaceae bacterium Marseille-Q3522]